MKPMQFGPTMRMPVRASQLDQLSLSPRRRARLGKARVVI
jgi:hypothetical protein